MSKGITVAGASEVEVVGANIEETLFEDLKSFSDRVLDLNFGFPIAMSWASISGLLHQQETDNFVKECGKVETKDGVTRHFVPIDVLTKYRAMERRRRAAKMYFDRMPGFYITSLIEELDIYMADLVEIMLVQGGTGAKLEDKNITYADLLKFDSFNEARDFLIDKEVDRVLREGIAGQIEWFNSVGLKIPLNHEFVLRAIELGERRNCIVHAECKANKYYIQNCKARGVSLGDVKEGDNLKPDKNYCARSFETALVLGCMLFSALWVKFCKKIDSDWDKLFDHLNTTIYDLMIDGKFRTALSLLKFVMDDLPVEPTALYRRILKINLALCYKETKQNREMDAIIKSEDWRGCDCQFQAAVSALKGETDKTLEHLRAGFVAKQIDRSAFTDWPVFNHIRPLKKFRSVFIELFGEKEAERALTDQVAARHIGPGMKKIVDEAIAQISALEDVGAEKSPKGKVRTPAAASNKAKPATAKKAKLGG